VIPQKKSDDGSGGGSGGSYLSVVTSYWWSKQQKGGPEHPAAEPVLWAAFERIDYSSGTATATTSAGGRAQQPPLCLVVAYTTGFQVWDVEDTADIREVCSKRDLAIRTARFLPAPEQQVPRSEQAAAFAQRRPLVALVSAEDTPAFPRTAVRVWSMRTREVVKGIRFASDVLALQCSARVLAVATRDKIYGFDVATCAERVFTVHAFPLPSPVSSATAPLSSADQLPTASAGQTAVATGGSGGSGDAPTPAMALGARWLAYPSNRPVVGKGQIVGEGRADPGSLARIARDVFKGAKAISEFANKLLYEGSVTPTAITTAATQDPSLPQSASVTSSDADVAVGSVAILDVVTRKEVAHFYAHG
jgi:hypothetical protein